MRGPSANTGSRLARRAACEGQAAFSARLDSPPRGLLAKLPGNCADRRYDRRARLSHDPPRKFPEISPSAVTQPIGFLPGR